MRTLLLVMALLGAACGSGSGEGSAPDVRDTGSSDAGLERDAGDAGAPVACGSAQCGPGEVCVMRSSGTDGGTGLSFVRCVAPTGSLNCSEAWTNRACLPTVCHEVRGSTLVCMGQ